MFTIEYPTPLVAPVERTAEQIAFDEAISSDYQATMRAWMLTLPLLSHVVAPEFHTDQVAFGEVPDAVIDAYTGANEATGIGDNATIGEVDGLAGSPGIGASESGGIAAPASSSE